MNDHIAIIKHGVIDLFGFFVYVIYVYLYHILYIYNLQVTKKQNRLIEVKAESVEKSLDLT